MKPKNRSANHFFYKISALWLVYRCLLGILFKKQKLLFSNFQSFRKPVGARLQVLIRLNANIIYSLFYV